MVKPPHLIGGVIQNLARTMDIRYISTQGADGRRVWIIQDQTCITTSGVNGKQSVSGAPRYELIDGSAGRAIGQDFEVAATGEILVRT